MNQATGVFPLCTLTRPDGSRCAAAALPGSNFCFQHIGGSVAALTRANKPQRQPAKIQLAYPGDRPSLQHNLHLIAQALSDGKIDAAETNAYNRLYRTAEINLRRWQTEHPNSPLVNPTEMGAPFKRSLSGEQEDEDKEYVGEQQPPALVIPTEATEGRAAEGPAFPNAGFATNTGEQKNNNVPDEDEEEKDHPWPSPEIAYRTYERLRKRYAEKLAAEEQEAEKLAAEEREAEKQEAERKNQPPAA